MNSSFLSLWFEFVALAVQVHGLIPPDPILCAFSYFFLFSIPLAARQDSASQKKYILLSTPFFPAVLSAARGWRAKL